MNRLKPAILAAAILSGSAAIASPALADCTGPRSAWAQPITNGEIPLNYQSTAQEIARFALPYADLVTYLREPDRQGLAPPGFIRGIDSNEWFRMFDAGALAWATITSFYAATFFHCDSNMLVIAFESINQRDPRDVLVMISRHVFGGWSPFANRFVEQVQAAYPGYKIVLTGHSGGGGLASYIGGRLDLPVIAFAPPRLPATVAHSGDRQLNVTVYGDPVADPNYISILPRPIAVPGLQLWLTVEVEKPFFQLHQLRTIMRGLEALQ